ncbi:hypothetical protein ACHAWU_009229 [Discostella pseudostelligera]|uniref:Vacuolar ATPase assembly protein VMA22 n=1 Tax=Discostella pseudostelligera TaxID=259834 RepID=A0ABD3MST0_9STRA
MTMMAAATSGTTATAAATAHSSSATPTISILTLLHQYQSLHASANDNLRQCFWNITKARRGRSYQTIASGGGKLEFTPEDVREELRAQALLEWKNTKTKNDIDLIESDVDVTRENNNINEDEATSSGAGKFVLHLDGMMKAMQQHSSREISQQPQQKHQHDTLISDSDEEPMGLRRRRHPAAAAGTTNQWTTETSYPIDEDNDDEQRQQNPLTLFGVPPPALRVAQSKSRDALAYYVEVANLAREIVQIINHQEKGNDKGMGTEK